MTKIVSKEINSEEIKCKALSVWREVRLRGIRKQGAELQWKEL